MMVLMGERVTFIIIVTMVDVVMMVLMVSLIASELLTADLHG